MKKIQLSIIALVGYSSLLVAGGDFAKITSYELDDRKEAESIEIIPVVPIISNSTSTAIVPDPSISNSTSTAIVPVVKSASSSSAVVAPPATVTALGLASSASYAYAGFGMLVVKYDTNCNCASGKSGVDKTVGFVGNVGYTFNNYIGLEARGLITTFKDNGGKVKHLGAFLKPMYPLSKNIKSYGLIGFSKTTTQGSLRRTNTSGLAVGLGLEYALSGTNLGVFSDYERLLVKSDSPDLDGVTLGLNYKF